MVHSGDVDLKPWACMMEALGKGARASRIHLANTLAMDDRSYTLVSRDFLHIRSMKRKGANFTTARALYVYQAAIPEELGFAKGDYLAVLRHQDDGWWEAEVHGGPGRVGLVPSNYLQPC
jgi:hypothetical protein